MPEYTYKFKAFLLRQIDKQYDMHLQAWLNERQASSTIKKGDKDVYVYKMFKDFFDYEKRVNEVLKPAKPKISENHKRLAQLAAHANRSNN